MNLYFNSKEKIISQQAFIVNYHYHDFDYASATMIELQDVNRIIVKEFIRNLIDFYRNYQINHHNILPSKRVLKITDFNNFTKMVMEENPDFLNDTVEETITLPVDIWETYEVKTYKYYESIQLRLKDPKIWFYMLAPYLERINAYDFMHLAIGCLIQALDPNNKGFYDIYDFIIYSKKNNRWLGLTINGMSYDVSYHVEINDEYILGIKGSVQISALQEFIADIDADKMHLYRLN